MASTIEQKPCIECGSSDNVKVFLNQFGIETSKCMTPDCTYNNNKKEKINPKFLQGVIKAIPFRKLTEETCRRFNCQTGKNEFGETVRVLNWMDNNAVIAQKIKRSPDPVTGKKRMHFEGHNNKVGLYGKWLWSPNPNLFITITEGEEDAMSIAQTQGYQYPVVSVPKGAKDAKSAIERDLQYLMGFKYVILALDNDEDGQTATKQCIEVLEPGKIRVATWPLKDANEMLMKGREREIREVLFTAKEVIPDKSVTSVDILDRILAPSSVGTTLPWNAMTEITGGLKPGEIIVFSAPPATGKTTIVNQIVQHVTQVGMRCGFFGLEQPTEEIIKKMVAQKKGLKYSDTVKWIEDDELKKEALLLTKDIYMYDDVGEITEHDFFSYIRFWNKAYGTTLFVLDNLQALENSDDLRVLKKFINRLLKTLKELKSTIILVAHVNVDGISQSTHVGFSSKIDNPHGNLTQESIRKTMNKFKLDWPNGRMPEAKNIEGGKFLVARAHCTIVFGRDRMSENDKTKRIIEGQCLKCRRDSTQDGRKFMLEQNNLGKLEEVSQIQTD